MLPKMIHCRPLTQALKNAYGDYMVLEESTATRLRDLGHVEFIGQEGTPALTPNTTQAKTDVTYLQRSAFGSSGLTRIAWVQDMSKMGGAELSNCVVVAAGEDCGFDVVGVTPGHFSEELLDAADLIVVNNCMEFTPEQFRALRLRLFEHRKPYIKYEHDYRELKRENIATALYRYARRCVFISPKHAADHQARFGDAISADRLVVLPLALDVSKYNPAPTPARDTVMLPTPRKYGAGMRVWVAAHPQFTYLVVGRSAEAIPAARVEHLPEVPNDRMASYYQRARYVVHLPEEPWAGERVVLEALLCGCEVVMNENVGHKSWGWHAMPQVRQNLRAAPFAFWREVASCISR
jgi:hypothetical protein